MNKKTTKYLVQIINLNIINKYNNQFNKNINF